MVKDKLSNLLDFLWSSLDSIETTMEETLEGINEFKKSIKKARDDLKKIKPGKDDLRVTQAAAADGELTAPASTRFSSGERKQGF